MSKKLQPASVYVADEITASGKHFPLSFGMAMFMSLITDLGFDTLEECLTSGTFSIPANQFKVMKHALNHGARIANKKTTQENKHKTNWTDEDCYDLADEDAENLEIVFASFFDAITIKQAKTAGEDVGKFKARMLKKAEKMLEV